MLGTEMEYWEPNIMIRNIYYALLSRIVLLILNWLIPSSEELSVIMERLTILLLK